MSTDQPVFAPVQRLDAERLIDSINSTLRLGLRFLGPAPGGNVGAAYVATADGRQSVLTWQPGSSTDRHREIADLLDIARRHGLAVPRYEHVLQVGSAVAIVQERLPGTPPGRVDRALTGQFVEVNARLRGVLADRPDIPAAQLYLRESGPGFCLHEPLHEYSDRTRRILQWVREVGAGCPDLMRGDDLVHLDFQPANVLVDDAGRLTGVIDWDGAARGDGRMDLVVLLFGLHSGCASPATIDWLWDRIREQLTADELRPYWASMSLRMIDWSIRHYSADDVEHWIDLAETRIDR
ncbi:MAG TPA: phosphotransferase [Mycobacteriales bacterium]|jgi:aminoglycoside phosphotransferase (APT) family kinase protein|nr:phosphotransferase [Mycobacteriales bacterium]